MELRLTVWFMQEFGLSTVSPEQPSLTKAAPRPVPAAVLGASFGPLKDVYGFKGLQFKVSDAGFQALSCAICVLDPILASCNKSRKTLASRGILRTEGKP